MKEPQSEFSFHPFRSPEAARHSPGRFFLSGQVAVRVRWSSAPTATTTPTSTLARGSTARTPTWGRTSRWTRPCRARRGASASRPSTATGRWRTSAAVWTPPTSSPRTPRGRSTTPTVRPENSDTRRLLMQPDQVI